MSVVSTSAPELSGLVVPGDGDTARTTITLPKEVMKLWEKRRREERRTKSGYLAWLIEEDAKRAGHS
jgi:hypothetical protein